MHDVQAVVQRVNGKHIPPLEDDEMATHQEKLDELTKAMLTLSTELTRKISQYELELAQSREIMHRIASSLEKSNNGNGKTSDWVKYGISLALVVAGWVFSGFVVIKNTESELRVSNAVRDERDKNLLEKFEKFEKKVERDMALQDERYRQLSITEEADKQRKRR